MLVCDGAGTLKLEEIKQICMKQGVSLELSAPYTPEENGKGARNWGTITSKARSLIEQRGHDKTYWPYAKNLSSDIRKLVTFRGTKEHHTKQCMD